MDLDDKSFTRVSGIQGLSSNVQYTSVKMVVQMMLQGVWNYSKSS